MNLSERNTYADAELIDLFCTLSRNEKFAVSQYIRGMIAERRLSGSAMPEKQESKNVKLRG